MARRSAHCNAARTARTLSALASIGTSIAVAMTAMTASACKRSKQEDPSATSGKPGELSVDQVCDKLEVLHSRGPKVSPKKLEERRPMCVQDALKTKSENVGRYNCIASCAALAENIGQFDRCREGCMTP